MNAIRDRLFNTDIYDGFNPDEYPSDVHGWNDHEAHFARLGANAQIVVEVGSWKGRSTLALARACPDASIIAIDTWLGAAEMWEDHHDMDRYGSLGLKHGFPTIYYKFLANIVRAGKQEQITPVPMPSTMALRFLKGRIPRPDLVFIDASHDEADVTADILGALELNPKVICGDDYGLWEGVTSAVRHAPFEAKVDGAFWWNEIP